MSKRKAYTPRRSAFAIAKSPGSSFSGPKPPVWDLYRDGLTYTLLSKFFVCPERFRLATVEGWGDNGLHAALEFGNAFHACMEHPDEIPEKVTQDYQRSRFARQSIHGEQIKEFELLMAMVEGVVHGYRKYWEKDNSAMNWAMREGQFDYKYRLPITTLYPSHPENSPPSTVYQHIRLRGKIDGVYRDLNDGNRLWIFETKTKSDIDQEGIHRTLRQDLQTMLYANAVEAMLGEPVAGVLYNVIRRPAIRPRKGSGKNPIQESLRDFSTRCHEDVLSRPDFYFHRWTVQFEEGDVANWRVKSFDPLLRHIVRWWDSIKTNPYDPWSSPYHFQRPFGIYDGLAAGRRGDFFDLMTSGSYNGLEQRSTAFPELE